MALSGPTLGSFRVIFEGGSRKLQKGTCMICTIIKVLGLSGPILGTVRVGISVSADIVNIGKADISISVSINADMEICKG